MSMRQRKGEVRLGLDGALWLTAAGQVLAGTARIALLRAIAENGSLTQAAKAAGVSYKGAWDAVDAMQRLAGAPLVERSSGGRGGGSTTLTPRGAKLVQRFAEIDAAHRRYVQLLDAAALDIERDFSLLDTVNMKTSARNQFSGFVSALRTGAVNDEVDVRLPGGATIVAGITRDSTAALGLRPRTKVVAMVKAQSVLLATELHGARISASNRLAGSVLRVTPGVVNADVVLALDGGGEIAAIVAQHSVAQLALAPGVAATALFNASDVILAVLSV